ncbi:MAG: sigma 54-interacting transcriptional regulator, partial [Deltaproteobacteria bacterium]|nr:sigma 54-interacting transcriptional regulator [Deltaproteobacteria bacterium]
MNILVADDDIAYLIALKSALQNSFPDHNIISVDDPVKALSLVNSSKFEIAVIDMSFGDGFETHGLVLLKNLVKNDPISRVIVVTGHTGKEIGWKALREGAHSFINKPFEIDHLIILLKDAINQYEIRSQASILEEVLSGFFFVFGVSEAGLLLKKQAYFAAENDLPVLLYGEVGTGKTTLAKLIHTLHTKRRKGRFAVFTPGIVNEEMLFSELFGAKKGAYTGLNETRVGVLELAHGGTLFIDEVGELTNSCQVMLLRALEEKVYRPLGSTEEKVSDFRLISATNIDVSQLVDKKLLREDFFSRISSVVIKVPSLEQRKTDIPILARAILDRLSREQDLPPLEISESVEEVLIKRGWKANIRELYHTLERAAHLAAFEG